MLSVLMQEIKSDTIFVLELSSYQLDDIKFSPNIAVVTNLFPEHMDYHKSVDNYYLAKRNIVNFQQDGDVLVYNPNNKKMAKWRTGSKFKAVPFAKAIPLKDSELPLIGEHNKDNIKAAISAVKQLGIKDDVILGNIFYSIIIILPFKLSININIKTNSKCRP